MDLFWPAHCFSHNSWSRLLSAFEYRGSTVPLAVFSKRASETSPNLCSLLLTRTDTCARPEGLPCPFSSIIKAKWGRPELVTFSAQRTCSRCVRAETNNGGRHVWKQRSRERLPKGVKQPNKRSARGKHKQSSRTVGQLSFQHGTRGNIPPKTTFHRVVKPSWSGTSPSR